MEETEKEREERVKQWEDFLDEGEEEEAKNSKDKDGQKTVANTDQSTTETVS